MKAEKIVSLFVVCILVADTVFLAGTAFAGQTWSEVAATGAEAANRSSEDSGVVLGEAVAPVSVATNAAGHLVFDFGRHVFGWIEVDAERPGAYEFAWGELLDGAGSVQTNEFYTRRQGTIRCAHVRGEFAKAGWTRIPYVADGVSAYNCHDVGRFGKVMPFRWLEVVSAPFEVAAKNVRQMQIHYPYDMSESSFSCDSVALERVYGFCKHTIRATSFMGVFVDGDRERLPYEGDSLITQLGTYAATSDDTVVRRTINHLSVHTTWPTEWKQFFISMVYEDWMHSGKTDLVRKYYDMMKDVKSWRNLRRADGLLVTPGEKMTPSPDGGMFCDIVDWAKCYRDGFVFTPVNVVVNALHYRNLKELEAMARAIGEGRDAAKFADEAAQTFDSFQRVFFDESAGRCRDGEGTDHATVQGNAMALACGAVPKAQAGRVADYVASRGFSCSTYMAHFVLDALFAAGREDEAIRLMASGGHRSWLGMMEKGATIAMEFWDLTMAESGRVPDMNHSWSTAPLNMVSRRVLGVTPLKPGFEEISIRPRPGPLKRLAGTVPTPQGPVRLKMERGGGRWNVELETPRAAEFSLGGRAVRLGAGRHSFASPLAIELSLPDAGERKVVRVDPEDGGRCVLSFSVPIVDVQQIWTPDMTTPLVGRKWWLSKASAPQFSMPCIVYFNMAERNRFFFGAEALEWDCLVESKINQERGAYEVKLTVAAGRNRTLKPFDVTLDRRDIPWAQTVADWRDSLRYRRWKYPDAAWEPAFCSWYAAHAAVNAEWVEKTAPIAADLGFGTFILDDGWSYDEAKRVNPDTIKTWYRDTGRWDSFSAAKFPDFRTHRERIRKLGLNYVVWVAPYFLGTRSESFRRWGYDRRLDLKPIEGNVLTDIENREMMESVTEQLVHLVRDCDMDGLKIDFIDSIEPSVENPHGARSLEYVSDLMSRLREVRADGLFEFRQNYATPVMAALATQFRAGDVPFEWLDNLMRIAQIRLTMGDGIPIHSDPIFWADAETEENVDRHFMAAMAGVPMLSMDLAKLSSPRRETVRKWMRLYRERIARFHRDGKWRVFYRNGGLVGLVGALPGKSFVIVNDPAGFDVLRSSCRSRELTVFNLGFEPMKLPDGTVVPPARAHFR